MLDAITGQHVDPFDPDHDGRVDYLYIKVANHIAARIQAGELRLGARLPGERDLAPECDVCIATVRATDELSRRGLVRVLSARGTYVVPVRAQILGEEPPDEDSDVEE